jgi:hypothetical protein
VNLKVSMGAWDPREAGDEVIQVHLPETSTILDVLFQFCYPERHPELNHLAFDILAEFSKAAEKYKVFSATDICRIRMKYVLHFFLEHLD